MPTVIRLAKTAAIAGLVLALGLALLIPSARAFAGNWTTEESEGLAQMTELSERSIVARRDGSTLAYLHADENRQTIKLRQIPDVVVNSVIGIEDEKFWDHHGIDMRGTFRALAENVSAGDLRQGGSTITQQLVKNSLLTPEKTVNRKVREALLAWRVEDHTSKEEILERYLNTVYFGNGAYGVQAAAEVYFDKEASQLDQADATLLAGLIRNPVGYDPIKFPDRARSRRRVVVDRLVRAGVISSGARDRVLARQLPTNVTSLEKTPNDYFVEEVKQSLLDDRRLGDTPTERYNAVFKGGLKIVTTLDGDMQASAREAVDSIVPASAANYRCPAGSTETNCPLTAALASIEPSTGAVRAIVGGKDFGTHKFNLATQSHRQAGSAFKTMVLVAAIRAGYGPSTVIDGTSPCTVNFPDHLPYKPGNYEGSGGGTVPLTQATAHSINCAYVRLAAAPGVGLERIEEAAKDLGITSDLKVHDCKCLTPSLALGGLDLGVSPLEMASAYATLAADGMYHKPYFIERVLDRNGKVLFRGSSKGEQRVAPQTARVAVSILRGVVTNGTGTRANPGKWPTFGKTGTAQDYTDAWFVGSTRQLAAAVWMGSPAGKVPMRGVAGVGNVFGGSFPARIFGAFMKEAMQGKPSLNFPAPDPKQVGNKQIEKAPGSSVADGEAPSTTEVFVGEPGVTIFDPGVGDGDQPGRPPRRTTTTNPGEPPPTQPGCQEPENWPPDYPPFCS
ncbi:MAG TPA: PBP1A family penicillin-binding protein [Acidimicrobiales bacterium]|nr:PBP1A family penicillin-binding protein [Acidimicrobiales bacterium]